MRQLPTGPESLNMQFCGCFRSHWPCRDEPFWVLRRRTRLFCHDPRLVVSLGAIKKWKSTLRIFVQNCLRILDEVEANRQEVIITRQGKPVARLSSFEKNSDRDPLLGSMEGLVETVGDLTEPVVGHESWELD